MENGNKIVILLLIVIIAGGGYILLVKYPPLLTGGGDTQYVTYTNQQTGTADTGSSNNAVHATSQSGIDYVYAGEVLGTPSDMKSLDLYAEPLDWDENPGNDGIVVHFTFYDAYGRKIIFSGSSISTQITVYSPAIDANGQTISPRRVFYKGYTTITSSDEGNDSPYGGIRIPYSSVQMTSTDLGIGQIKMTASLPAGGTIEAYETFLWPKT